MRRFRLYRDTDTTGVSGTGAITEGVEYSDGVCAMRWIATPVRSTSVYNTIADLIAVHGHDGATRVDWLDPDEDGEWGWPA